MVAVRERALPLSPLVSTGTCARKPESISDTLRSPTSGERGEPCELSFAQERLWFLCQLEPQSPVYNLPWSLRWPGPLNVGALERSVSEIVRRHEALRTTFREVDGRPFQVVEAAGPAELRLVDLRDRPEESREAEGQRLLLEESLRPFDLAKGPLFRALLVRLADAEHLLLLGMHHIVSDGWSIGVLSRELSAVYEAFSSGRRSPLAELPLQYADYARWQREWLQGEVLEDLLGYWRERLAGAPTVLELPTDRARPPLQSYRGAAQGFFVAPAAVQGLRELSQSEEATLFMTLLAAFKVLLSRYTGQRDLVMGTPIANRNRLEIEGLVGFFVNTLALRTDLSGDPSFRLLLRRVREVTLGAYAHQDLPFERLVEELQPERHLSHHPLFQVMFALQNTPTLAEVPGGVESEPPAEAPGPLGLGTAKFDLSLFLGETVEGLGGVLEYATDLFEHATAARLVGHYQTLLAGIVEDPGRRLSELPLLSAEERSRLLEHWSGVATGEVGGESVLHLFERQVERSPNATAAVFEDASLTYKELNERANRLGWHLRDLGVGADARVGVCLERSLDAVVTILGVLKAGGAYVPLDPAYPEARLAFMIADVETDVLVTSSRLADRLPAGAQAVVELDSDWPEIARRPAQDLGLGTEASELAAFVIYTSGSTGIPKGVVMPQRALFDLIAWQVRAASLPPAAATLQLASLSFDVSFQEMFSTWCSGGILVLLSEAERLDPATVLTICKRHAVERIFLPPVYLEQLAEAFLEPGMPQPPIRHVIAAGDRLRITPAIAAFVDVGNECVLWNQYGPTESHVVTQYRVPASVADGTLPPIGSPIRNARVYILDRSMQPVPEGIPGVLHAGGMVLARGYFGRPALTAERFLPDPFSGEPGGRLYLTGDLARFLAAGTIEFIGRTDHQIKLRGFRVETGEVEDLLSRHPLVGAAVVAAIADGAGPSGSQRLVAYLVAAGAEPPAADEIERYLRQILPDYMVPATYVVLEALPLSPNGKVDRKALSPPGPAAAASSFVAPRNSLEETLTAIWREVLGTPNVGVRDNFFQLGGHSLLAIQVASRVRRAFDMEMPLQHLFEAPTVAGLARAIETLLWMVDRPGDEPGTVFEEGII